QESGTGIESAAQKRNPAIHIAGFEAVSIRRKKLIQKETHLPYGDRLGLFKFPWADPKGRDGGLTHRRVAAGGYLRSVAALDGLRGVRGGAAHVGVGQADDLLAGLLELVEGGGRRGDRRLERIDGGLGTGRGRLAGLVDPRRH